MGIVPPTAPKSLTSDRDFSNDLLIVDAYSKITKFYGMEKITTEEVMDKSGFKISSLSITSSVVIFSIP